MAQDEQKINLKIDIARLKEFGLKARDLKAAENGRSFTETLTLLSRLMVDEAGEWMDPEDALALLEDGDMFDPAFLEVINTAGEAVNKELEKFFRSARRAAGH